MEYFVTIESGSCKDMEQVGEIYDKLSSKKSQDSTLYMCYCFIKKRKRKDTGAMLLTLLVVKDRFVFV